MSVEAMKQALNALNTTNTHPISSHEQYDKEMWAMEALEDAIADAEEVTVDWEAVAADQAMTIAMMRQREWQGLTDDEILAFVFDAKITEPNDEPIKLGAPSRKCIKDLVSCVEAKLKEKNNV